jgi:hypothetical protein
MGIPREPKPAKYFTALLFSDAGLMTAVEADLASLLGTIDGRTDAVPWTVSRFYETEMGTGLLRRFVCFQPLRSPADLSSIKLRTQNIEDRYRSVRSDCSVRRINIDPGYIVAGKVVLASTKNANHRIYLGDGIYAEVTLLYHDGGFHGCPYTYRDYLWPETLAFMRAIRIAYLDQLRSSSHTDGAAK